ncbi:MAG TPA: hypothetical protein VD741_05550 [Solirubrobacterales bacterium]|nr:hypothetical protein [Solirubrobacterales bacterium]
MNPERSNVFKFVSVRPVQLAGKEETEHSIIRDARTGREDGLEKLTRFARKIDSPAAAARHWERLSLGALEPLAAAQRTLVEAYRRLAEGDPDPSGPELLRDLDLKPGGDEGLAAEAWDALYVAHATGSAAGERLDLPIAALRTLHYAAGLSGDPTPDRTRALARLTAQPAIAPPLDAALRPAGAVPAPPAEPPSPPGNVPLASRGQQIASELTSARELLAALARPEPARPVKGDASEPEPAEKWSRQHLRVEAAPALTAVLGSEISGAKASILDRLGVTRQTPVPVAAQKLQEHVVALSEQAFALAGQREFEVGLEKSIKFPLPKPRPSGSDPSTAPDVDVHGRIKPLGVGDLKVVKQELLAYEPGEVAYIENVLKGETKKREHRSLDRTETTLMRIEEEAKETQRDTQSTDRFELKREAAQTIKEDMSIKAGLSVTASYGPIVATASGDFAYSTAKEQSEKSSAEFARQVVDRSISKIQTKVVSQRTVNTINEVEETNTHTLDNDEGSEHVVGIYRWVDKRYRAQIYNYGLRMMLEFVIPEPGAFFLAAHSGSQLKVDAEPPVPFLNDLTAGLPKFLARTLTASDLDETNYRRYAARYGATGISPPPPLFRSIGTSLSVENIEEGKSIAATSKEFVVPEGYTLSGYRFSASVLWTNHPKFTVQVGGRHHTLVNDPSGGHARLIATDVGSTDAISDGTVPLSVAAYDVRAYSVTIEGDCKRIPEAFAAWQLQTYDKIAEAYRAQKTAYDQQVAEAKARAAESIQGHNPALNRSIVQSELKKLCITMMTGQHFRQFDAVTNPSDAPIRHPEIDVEEALREGPIIQFFEQAFEWEQMTYLFYPYFWGRKSKWVNLTTNVEDSDPVFQQFLTAGACRVVVPVPIAYSKAVIYMLQSPATDLAQKVWLGGEPPTLESPLYESLAEEIRDQTDDLDGATPEGAPWEFKLPTTLVWLQPGSELPVFSS